MTTDEILIQDLTEALANTLLHVGKHLPKEDRRQREILVKQAREYLSN